MTLAKPRTHFERPPASDAVEPPEAHGVARDSVKLMIATPGGVVHGRFADLSEHLAAGDLLVVNNSATLPAAVDGIRGSAPIAVHFSTALDDHVWIVELRPATNATAQLRDVEPGERIGLPDGAALVVIASYPEPGVMGSRLWISRLAIEGDVTSYLGRHGRPIRYGHVPRPWPLSSYQTVFARRPGSAEMASAARPFSTALVASLVSAGIVLAPITLHAGVSSAEPGEPPVAEPFEVPPTTARLDGSGPRAGPRATRGRRTDHRLARRRRLAPVAARSDRRACAGGRGVWRSDRQRISMARIRRQRAAAPYPPAIPLSNRSHTASISLRA